MFRRLYYNTLGGTFLYKFILLMIKKTAHRYPLSQLARAAKVHYFDGTPLGVTEEDVLRLQVTVDDAEFRRGQEEQRRA